MKTEQTFSHKHPIISGLLGLVILGGITILSVYLLKWLFYEIGEGVIYFGNWLKTFTSSLDAVIIVALISSAVSVIGVIITSVIGKIVEYRQRRMEYLYQKREKPYYAFIEMVYKVQSQVKNHRVYSEEELMSDMSNFSQQLTLWGSNRVIKKYNRFREIAISHCDSTDILFASEDLIYAMRSDMGLHKMKKGIILSININDINKILNGKENKNDEK